MCFTSDTVCVLSIAGVVSNSVSSESSNKSSKKSSSSSLDLVACSIAGGSSFAWLASSMTKFIYFTAQNIGMLCQGLGKARLIDVANCEMNGIAPPKPDRSLFKAIYSKAYDCIQEMKWVFNSSTSMDPSGRYPFSEKLLSNCETVLQSLVLILASDSLPSI